VNTHAPERTDPHVRAHRRDANAWWRRAVARV